MKFSLVLATIGRVEELKKFLSSLELQHYSNLELLLIDQNPDDRVVPILASHQGSFSIKRLRSAPGLARARNIALPHLNGDVVAFPDDDCWYPQGLLERVARLFSDHLEWDGITARPAGPAGEPWRGWAQGYGALAPKGILKRGISFTIFLRQKVIRVVGNFDEHLGAGAGTPWNWGEESDYLFRALQKGFVVYDHGGLIVCHEDSTNRHDSAARVKERSQSLGMGYFLGKHRFPAPLVAYHLLRPLGGFLYYSATGRASRALHRITAFRGRLLGYYAALRGY